jgi:hypothetical protein
MKMTTQIVCASELGDAALNIQTGLMPRNGRSFTMNFDPETIVLLTGLIASGLFVLAWPAG